MTLKTIYVLIPLAILVSACRKNFQCDCNTSTPNYKGSVNPMTYHYKERNGKTALAECERDYLVRDKFGIVGYTCSVHN